MMSKPNQKSYKNYLFFWSGQLFSLFGSSVIFFVIRWWVIVQTGSVILLSIVSFLYILPQIFVSPIAGILSDTQNRKKIIIIADSLQAFNTFLLILLFIFNLASIWIIFFFITIRGIFQAFHSPTVKSIIPSMVPKEKLSKINGINFFFSGGLKILSSLAASILIIVWTYDQIFWIDIFTFLISIIPLIIIHIPLVKPVSDKPTDRKKKVSFYKEFKLGISILISIPGFLAILILSALVNFLFKPLDTLMPYFIYTLHGGNALHFALFLGIMQVGILCGAITTLVKKTWNNKLRNIFIGIIILFIGYAIVALAPIGNFILIYIGGGIIGFNLLIISSLYQTIMQITIPRDKIGRILSIDFSISIAISSIGSLVSGLLSEIFGISTLFFLCSFIAIFITIIVWIFTSYRNIDFDDIEYLEKVAHKINNLNKKN